MNPLRWLFELRDQVSGPARRINREMREMRGSLREASQRVDTFGRRSLGRADLSIRGINTRVRGMTSGLGLSALRAAGIVGAVMAIGSGLQSGLDVLTRMARAAGELALNFGRAVTEAATFRTRATFGLTLLTGSRGAAAEVLEEARQLSQFLGTDLHETIAGIQDLMVRGFSRRASSTLFQAMADLRAISPRPVDTSRILLAIGQIQQAGRLQGDELNQLAESGLPLDAIRQRMATNLGVQVSQLRDLQQAGRISSEVALRSIVQGISDVTGSAVGTAGRDFSMTLPGMIERLQQAPTRIFDAIATRSDGAFGRVREMLVSILDLLDPDSAGFARLVEVGVAAFDTLVETLRTAWEVGRVFFDGLREALGANPEQGALQSFRDWMVEIRSDRETMQTIREIGQAVGMVTMAVVGLVRVVGPIAIYLQTAFYRGIAVVVAFSTWLHGLFSSIATSAVTFGRNIVMGLVSGITSGVAVLRNAAVNMGQTVRSGLDSVLRFGSPSREMRYLGAMTGEGFVRGLATTMPDTVPELGSVPRLGPGAASAGGGAPVINLSVSVQGGGSSEELAQALRRILLPELEVALEQLAIEQGVG